MGRHDEVSVSINLRLAALAASIRSLSATCRSVFGSKPFEHANDLSDSTSVDRWLLDRELRGLAAG